MSSTYELWLLDDGGRRILNLEKCAFFSYSRTVSNMGTIQIGFPLQEWKKRISPVFSPDWRIDVWRSPGKDFPLRREQVYLMRMFDIYTREDGVEMIVFYGRDPKDLLNRRYIVQMAGTAQTRKTLPLDDMMKEIVREQMLYSNALDPDGVTAPERAWPTGEFLVQAAQSLGPTQTLTFADRNVLDVLREIQASSESLYTQDVANSRIYFDVVPFELKGIVEEILDEADPSDPILDEMGMAVLDELSLIVSTELGFRFETYADLRGADRTAGLEFSVANNNLRLPEYSKSHLEEKNTVIIKGFGRGEARAWAELQDADLVNASRWNRCETFKDSSTEPDQTNLEGTGYQVLDDNRPKEVLNATFLNVPEGPDSPRSLYGVDWDMGDLLPIFYAGKRLNVIVEIVYVALDENGKETITGRNTLNAGDQTE